MPVAELTIQDGSATAVWEVVNTSYLSSDTLRFGVYATLGASTAAGTATVTVGYAPASSTLPAATVPQFANGTVTLNSFVTAGCLPGTPILSSPANGATGAPVAPTLTWNAATGADSYDVYFGTSSQPPFVQNTAATSYSPGTLASATTYYWKIVARNAGGNVGSSTWSFTTAVPCTYALTSTSGIAPAAGGSGQVAVSTGAACSWTATSTDPWITIVSGSGTGPGTVNYSVAAYSGTAARSGAVSAGGQLYTVTQFGQGCSMVVTPAIFNVPATSTVVSGMVWAPQSSCSWTASGLAAAPASGTGSSPIALVIPANPSTSARVLSGTIAGQTVTVNQAGQSAPTCAATVNVQSFFFSAAGGSNSFPVSLPSGCSYTATAAPDWITITSGGSGTASGTVAFSAAPNSSLTSRTGSISVGGQTVPVTQGAAECSLSVDTSSSGSPFAAGGGAGTLAVTTGCTWSASSEAAWLSIVGSASRTGSGTVTFAVSPNTSAAARSGSLVIGGQQIGITQYGTACSYSLRSSSGTVPASGGSGSAGVVTASACTWSAVSNASWLTITASGSVGTADVQFSAAPNTVSASRMGTLTVAGLAYTVTQAGAPCAFVLTSAASGTVAAAGTTTPQTFGFTTSAGCSATAASFAGWITASTSSGGGSSGTVAYTVAANPSSSPRTGTIQLGNQTFTVTQAGASCGYTLSSYGASFGLSGGTGTVVAVQSGTGCTTPVVSSADASVVQLGALSGPVSNTWTLPYTVAPFSSTQSAVRRVVIGFGGQSFTVKQTSW